MYLNEDVNTYGFSVGPEYPECLDKRQVCLGGGVNGNWAGSAEKALEVASWLKSLDIKPGSQKRSREKTASGRRSDHWEGSKDSYGVDLPCKGEKGDNGWKKLRDEFKSRGWIGDGDMPDKLLEKGKGKWVNFNVGNYRYQVGWNVSGHYDHIHVGVRNKNPDKESPNDNNRKENENILNLLLTKIQKTENSPVTILMGGLNYRENDKSTSQQGGLLEIGLGSKNVIAIDYNNLTKVKKEIDNNPNNFLVLFSAGASYASSLVDYVKEKGGNIENIYVVEPCTCPGYCDNGLDSVENAIAKGLPKTNILVGDSDCTGKNIGGVRSDCTPKHWCALTKVGELIKNKIGDTNFSKPNELSKLTNSSKIGDKDVKSTVKHFKDLFKNSDIFNNLTKEQKGQLTEEIKKINGLIKII